MKKFISKIDMLLLKTIVFSTITLFSVLLINPTPTSSANFKYSDFDWDTFSKANNEFWEGYCNSEDEDSKKEDCQDRILKSQEKFYKKLYKILAKYEKRGLFIDDNIILETVFIDMTPSEFSDDGVSYMESWGTEAGAYVIDGEDFLDEEIDVEYTDSYYEKYGEYFSEEKDTLKLLIQNMVAYSTNCYGIYGDPTAHTKDDGSTSYSCSRGVSTSLPLKGTKCADTLLSYEYGFWEYYISRWANDYTLLHNRILPFLHRTFVDPRYEECMTLGSSYPGKSVYVYNNDRHISYDRYFDFLSYNIYFDKKAHLQKRFEESILKPAGVECMTNDVCENSLEAAGLYDEYEGEIIRVRQEIIDDIIGILNNYGIDISYNSENTNEFIEATFDESTRKSYYWPIGSDETEVRDGVTYADKDPASTDVISYYGIRKNPITKEDEMHYGIYIEGVEGKTNVIAAYSGEVITVVKNCQKGDYECNEGYGNMIIISHSNGDYTVYAGLASIDSSVRVGTSVQKGQLIGKVGSTGKTNTSMLHYEIRKGGNDISFAVDPLSISSTKDPRPKPAAGDFSVHKTSLNKEEFVSKMRNYCNTTKCSSTFLNVFVAHAADVYTVSISSNVNPELVVIRALNEGLSPGGRTNNYWGISCYNGAGTSACSKYSSLAAGIRGFAKVVSKYETVSEMMSKYAYIGAFWYNPGSWSLGGCKYYSYISKFMSSSRSNQVAKICSESRCTGKESTCVKTTSEDQKAYATWQVNDKMVPLRYNIFGL